MYLRCWTRFNKQITRFGRAPAGASRRRHTQSPPLRILSVFDTPVPCQRAAAHDEPGYPEPSQGKISMGKKRGYADPGGIVGLLPVQDKKSPRSRGLLLIKLRPFSTPFPASQSWPA